jgi:hypothetical protein
MAEAPLKMVVPQRTAECLEEIRKLLVVVRGERGAKAWQ